MAALDSLELILDKPRRFELHRQGNEYLIMVVNGGCLDTHDKLENPVPATDAEARSRFRQYALEYNHDYHTGWIGGDQETLAREFSALMDLPDDAVELEPDRSA